MKIVELSVSNFARLKAIEIRPDGAIVPITGKNGAGKSSVLKAIWALIEGRAAAPAVAIRKGQDECTIEGDLGEYKITRSIKRAKDGTEAWDLKVVAADGSRMAKTPQAVINAFKGDVAFDPLGWCRLPAKDQVAALRSLVDFDFDAAARKRKEAYDARTTANRQAVEREHAAAAIQLPPGPPPKAVDVSAKIDELQRAGARNAAIEREAAERKNARAESDRLMDEAEQLRARAAAVEKRAKALDADQDARPPLNPPADVAALRAEIAKAEEVKGVLAMHESRKRHREDAVAFKAKAGILTEQIEQIDADQIAAIAAAKLPVEGLSLTDEAVMLRGVPLAQAGTAEKIEAAVALAMAKNPRLKVITVDEGSELDSDAMEFIAKLAEERGFQVWVARVDETREVGFVIEDGEIAQ